jgi:hypothetical protein
MKNNHPVKNKHRCIQIYLWISLLKRVLPKSMNTVPGPVEHLHLSGFIERASKIIVGAACSRDIKWRGCKPLPLKFI